MATDDCIDFVEIKSRIAAAEFVGVRSISAGAAALLDSVRPRLPQISLPGNSPLALFDIQCMWVFLRFLTARQMR